MSPTVPPPTVPPPEPRTPVTPHAPHFSPRQEREEVDGKRLFYVGAVSTVITIASIVIAWRFERAATRHPWEYSNIPAPATSGTADKALLGPPGHGETMKRAHRDELARWGWADRDAGVARVPIDQAIDMWIARQAPPAQGPAPSAPPPRPTMPTTRQEPGVELGVKAPDWRGH